MNELAHVAELVDVLDGADPKVIMNWTCPVPYFGVLGRARLATVGLNPSSREFVGDFGEELTGDERRFPTLRSMRLKRWSEADASNIADIVDACDGYFSRRPYDRWFRVLDQAISGTRLSYYARDRQAAHVDLVPFATLTKWGQLSPSQRLQATKAGRDTILALLAMSPVQMLVLNGQSVVDAFSAEFGVEFSAEVQPKWTLPRVGSSGIPGISYMATLDRILGEQLDRRLVVIGFNHNLQSSFGVTTDALVGIRSWIGVQWEKTLA
jgi:hypothetical protein